MSLNKVILFFLVSVIVIHVVSAERPFYFPETHNVSSDTNIILSVRNLTPVTLPVEIHYKPLYAIHWHKQTASFNGKGYQISMPAPMIEDVFEWYVKNPGYRLPDHNGSFKIYSSSKELFFEDEALKFITHQQTNIEYCRPYSGDSGYHCLLGNMHAEEALRFAYAYERTGNQTLKEISERLISSRYYNKIPYHTQFCDHYQDDYDCDLADGNFGYQITGAKRQGIMIYSFTRSSQILDNLTILRHAEKYANGSAGECDVWEGDYDCLDSESQGAMILGYWTIYENMPYSSYKSIAESLTQAGFSLPSSPYLLMGFAKAYGMTGNLSYLSRMNAIAHEIREVCRASPCDPATQGVHVQAFFQAFMETGDRIYQKTALDKLLAGTSVSCNPLVENYACFDSEQQGKLNQAYFHASIYSPSEGRFLDPRLIEKPNPGDGAKIGFSSQGYIKQPVINIKGPGDITWASYNLAYQDQDFSLPPINSSGTGIYRFFLSSESGARWPEGNATYSFIIPIYYPLLDVLAEGLSNNDPMSNCDPHGTNPLTSDFACRNEVFQGWQVLGFSEYTRVTNDSAETQSKLNIIMNLSHTKIDDLENELIFGDRRTTCEYVLDEYSCQAYGEYAADPDWQEGAKRQALHILSALEAYSLTKNTSFRERAIRYLEEAPQECSPFENDMDCGSPETQGLLSLAHLEAYNVIGEPRYLDSGLNLTIPIFSSEPEQFSALALWKAYLYTSNMEYFYAARNKSLQVAGQCSNSYTCTQKDLMKHLILMWESLLHSPTDMSFLDSALQKSLIIEPVDTDFTCNPHQDRYSCRTPDVQGISMVAFSRSASNYYTEYNLSVSINISSPERVDYFMDFPVECKVNNTGNYTSSYDLFFVAGGSTLVNVSTSGSFTALDKVSFLGHPPSQEITTTWHVRAVKGGPTNLRCIVMPTFVDSTQVIIENLFDVLAIDITKNAWTKKGDVSHHNYSVRNNVSFPLYNVSVDLALLFNSTPINDSRLVILNISSEQMTFTNGSGFTHLLLSNESARFQVSFLSGSEGDYSLEINATTGYGGNTSTTQVVYSYDTVYIANNTIPSLCVIRSIFDVVYRITNNESFNLTDMMLSFERPDFFTILNNSFSGGDVTTLNLTHSSINALEPGQEIHLAYTVYSSEALEGNFTFHAQPALPKIDYSVSQGVSCINSTFEMNITLIPPEIISFESGVTHSFGLRGNISNVISLNLTNILIEAMFDQGLNITRILPNTTIEKRAVFPAVSSNSSITSLINKTDNSSFRIDNSSIILFMNDSVLTSMISRNLTLRFNSTSPFSADISNSTHTLTSCVFPISASVIDHSCAIAADGVLLNISVPDGIVYIDSVLVTTVYEFLKNQGQVLGEKIVLSSIRPGETAYFGWDFLLHSDHDTQIIIRAVSSENGYITKEMNLSAYTIVLPPSVAGGSSSGGGGPMIMNETEEEDVTILDFSDQDTIRLILDHPELQENVSLWHETSQFFNTTEMLKGCLHGERVLAGNTLIFRFTSRCEEIIDEFKVYDIIDKSVFSSTDHVNVTISKGSYKIIHKDPAILFHYGVFHPGEAVWHSYEPVNNSGKFYVPHILGKIDTIIDETIGNQTDVNLSDVDPLLDATSGSQEMTKGHLTGLDQIFLFIHMNMKRLSFWAVVLILLIVVLIMHPVSRLRSGLQAIEYRKLPRPISSSKTSHVQLSKKVYDTFNFMVFINKRWIMEMQSGLFTYLNARNRDKALKSLMEPVHEYERAIDFSSVSEDTFFLAQEVNDSPDLGNVFVSIRNNLASLKRLSKKEKRSTYELELFLSRIKIEIIQGIEQRADRSQAIKQFQMLKDIFGPYDQDRILSQSSSEKMDAEMMAFSAASHQDHKRKSMLGKSRASQKEEPRKGKLDNDEDLHAGITPSPKPEEIRSQIEDIYFLAQSIQELATKGDPDKLEPDLERLRSLSESVTINLERADPTMQRFYDLHIRHLIEVLFTEYEKK